MSCGDVCFQIASSERLPEPPEKRSPVGMSHWLPLPFVVAVVLCAGIVSSPHARANDRQQKLESLLQRYPAADANKDGKLTVEEAKAHLAANPELRQKKRPDAKGKTGGESNATVSAQVLELFEAREFKEVKYRLLKPIDLAKNHDQKYPLILSLHGAGGIGNDNVRNLREWCADMAQEEWRRKHPCFVVAPQTFGFWRTPAMSAHYSNESIAKMSADWHEIVSGHRKRLQDPNGANLDRVYLLLDELANEFPIDTDRVYVLGHSGGGFGTWTAVSDQPNRFAAAITSAGWLAPWFDANAVKDVPIWSFQGARDKTSQVSLGNSTFERMKELGAKVKFTELANHGHNVNEAAFAYTGDTETNGGVTKYASDRCDKTADVWDWLFAQKRAAKKDGKPTKGDPARWEDTIKQFEATDAATPPPKGGVLLVGGSNARRWTDVGEYFPQHHVINRGFGGARLTDVLHYTDRIVLPYAPKTIILNVGGNDLKSGKTPEQIRDATRAFVTKVHAALPETRIYCIGVPPTRKASTTPEGFNSIRALNVLIAELSRTEKNVEFIDLFPAFLDDKGQHRVELFVEDGTHFNADGYKTLAGLLRGKF